MPEGDTIHKIAAYLRPRLEGVKLTSARIRRFPGEIVDGTTIRSVQATGKHLLMQLDDGRLLRSHLGMHGSWHRYRRDEPWRKPRRQATIELHVGDEVYVCFNAKEVELLRDRGVRQRILEARLGPDVTAPSPDLPLAVARARRFLEPEALIADVLLDQRVACGIGNVYKSELLFLERIHPERTLRAIDDETLERLYRLAHDLLRRNLGGGPRTTRFVEDGTGRAWVYGRRGRPCFRCGDPIRSRRLGRTQRVTYWCSRCQAR
jgi:endonuclease-8